ncbi:MAG: HU family DNA-binding protein [Spirochaetales bacterium]|nr:HU family DNA-binding protein [Spirochaetales bacterium]
MAFKDLPMEIQKHLEALVKVLPERDENALELYAGVWEKKEALFRSQISALDMDLVDRIDPYEGNGILLLTNSGSLLSLTPGKDERSLEYSSIKLRTDVPDIIIDKISKLPQMIELGKPVVFPEGKISKTSPVHLIAICAHAISPDEQEKRVREATIFLTNGFMKLNRTLHIDPSSVPDQYTMKSMLRYVAKKNDMKANDVKRILDDFLYLIETGLCLEETVPLGKIGRFYVKKKEAQKARVVKHPSTGKEVMVEAKPAVLTPKVSFSSYLKDKLSELPTEDETLLQ